VVILEETRFQDKIKKMCSKSDELYNEKFASVRGSLSCEAATTNIGNKGSSMSFVDEDIIPNKTDIFAGGNKMTRKSSGFPVTVQERRYYTTICNLASSSQYSK